MPDLSPTLSPIAAIVLFWALVVACAIAQLFIVRGLYHADPAGASPNASREGVPTPRRWMEVAWAVLPIAGLIATFLGAWRLMPR
jgi:hypothetical protein